MQWKAEVAFAIASGVMAVGTAVAAGGRTTGSAIWISSNGDRCRPRCRKAPRPR